MRRGDRDRIESPVRLDARGPQLRLPAIAEIAERGAEVIIRRRERVERETHLVDTAPQHVEQLFALDRAALDTRYRGEELRAETVVHVAHDALALILDRTIAFELRHRLEVA